MAAADEYVSSRWVGDVRVTAINEGKLPLSVNLTVPEEVWRQEISADSGGKIPLDVNVLLVQTGDATILVDAGLDEPESNWNRRFLDRWPRSVRTPGVVAGLASMGVKPEDVTHVLITHTHFDHTVGVAAEQDRRLVPRYPNARVLVGRADWEHAPEGQLAMEQQEPRIGALAEAGLLDLVDSEREIVSHVTMIPSPGESSGHSLIRISSNHQTLFAVGDLFHYAAEVAHPHWMVTWADQKQMQASRRKLLDDAVSTNALVVFTHANFPPWGRIVPNEDSDFSWRRA